MIGHVVELVDASVVYPGDPPVTALEGTSVEISAGAYLSITGRSGSGKTTLLALAGGLRAPSAGTVRIAGQDLWSLPERERTRLRASQVGFVFQAFHLIERMTVLDNAALALRISGMPAPDARARAADALASVGLTHRLAASARTLSGGERQRLAVARAVTSGCSVLLCDEPTGNLDRDTARSVVDTIEATLSTGAAVVMVTHDAALARRADERLALVDGALCIPSRPEGR